MKRALITGITGQDGSYLTEFLPEFGCGGRGISRRAGAFGTLIIGGPAVRGIVGKSFYQL